MNPAEFLTTYSGLIFMVGGFIFFPPLVKAIIVNRREGTAWPIFTSLPTGAVLWFYAFTFVAMELVLPGLYFWLSAFATFLTAGAWTWLLLQGVKLRRPS